MIIFFSPWTFRKISYLKPGKTLVLKKILKAKIDGRPKKIHSPGMMSDWFGIRFKMFLLVELTKLGGQNFKLGLYSEMFKLWKWKVIWNRYFKTLIEQPISVQKWLLFTKMINTGIIFRNLFDQKRSFYTDLR